MTGTTASIAQAAATPHACHAEDLTEVRLSTCAAGCKIMACSDCGAEYVAHSALYGCQRVREDYFRPLRSPSIATVHRQWLDRALPAQTWASYARSPRPVVTR